MSIIRIPVPTSPFAEPKETPQGTTLVVTPEWHRYFRQLTSALGSDTDGIENGAFAVAAAALTHRPPRLPSLTNEHIFVGNSANVPTDVAVSGDVTIANTGAVTIGNDKVTYAKMQNISATQRVLGRNTAGAGDTEEVSASGVLDWIGSTRGSVLYRGASGWAALTPGTSGHVLTSNGAGADPSYQAGGSASGGVPWPAFTTPVDGDFAWINQGGASVTVNGNGGIHLIAPASASPSLRIRKKTAPSTPYTVTACFLMNCAALDFLNAGLIWRQASDGKLVTAAFSSGNTLSDFVFTCQDWTNATTFSAGNLNFSMVLSGLVWLRIADNGTNRIVSYSFDGYNFVDWFSEGRTTFMTADEVGFFANSQTSSAASSCTLLSWEET